MLRKLLRLIWTDVGAALPAIDENHRGTVALKRASATEDEVYIGLQDSADAMQWRQFLTKTLGDALYSDISHDHDSDYADISHNHDSDYADISHNHDSDYADISHTHSGTYLETGPDFRDLFPLNDEITTPGPFNFRQLPSTSATILTSATAGTALYDSGERVTADAVNWAFIFLEDAGWGWITVSAID